MTSGFEVEPVLQVRDLTCTFPAEGRSVVRALDQVSFDLEAGGSLGLVGESGCGKTTLALCLMRLLEPDSGAIRFAGLDWLALKGRRLRRARCRIQMVFQDPFASLNPRLRIQEIIEEPLLATERPPQAERVAMVERALEAVGLEAEHRLRRPADFSGGQRQRIAIARAIIVRPQLLVADEPVSALDPSAREQILDLVVRLRDELHLSLLLISHQLDLVERACERVAVMYRGGLMEVGRAAEILQRPCHPYTTALLSAAPRDGALPVCSTESISSAGVLREIAPGHWVRG